jgi:hypothetical protein
LSGILLLDVPEEDVGPITEEDGPVIGDGTGEYISLLLFSFKCLMTFKTTVLFVLCGRNKLG